MRRVDASRFIPISLQLPDVVKWAQGWTAREWAGLAVDNPSPAAMALRHLTCKQIASREVTLIAELDIDPYATILATPLQLAGLEGLEGPVAVDQLGGMAVPPSWLHGGGAHLGTPLRPAASGGVASSSV